MKDPLVRFSVAIGGELLRKFDQYRELHRYPNRSEAVRGLMRAALIEETIADDESEAMGVVTLIYDHHVSRIARRLTDLQHHHLDRVVTTTHVHLDEKRCLEVILLRGPAQGDPRPGRRPDRHQGRRDRPARPGLGQARSRRKRRGRPSSPPRHDHDHHHHHDTLTNHEQTADGCRLRPTIQHEISGSRGIPAARVRSGRAFWNGESRRDDSSAAAMRCAGRARGPRPARGRRARVDRLGLDADGRRARARAGRAGTSRRLSSVGAASRDGHARSVEARPGRPAGSARSRSRRRRLRCRPENSAVKLRCRMPWLHVFGLALGFQPSWPASHAASQMAIRGGRVGSGDRASMCTESIRFKLSIWHDGSKNCATSSRQRASPNQALSRLHGQRLGSSPSRSAPASAPGSGRSRTSREHSSARSRKSDLVLPRVARPPEHHAASRPRATAGPRRGPGRPHWARRAARSARSRPAAGPVPASGRAPRLRP